MKRGSKGEGRSELEVRVPRVAILDSIHIERIKGEM